MYHHSKPNMCVSIPQMAHMGLRYVSPFTGYPHWCLSPSTQTSRQRMPSFGTPQTTCASATGALFRDRPAIRVEDTRRWYTPNVLEGLLPYKMDPKTSYKQGPISLHLERCYLFTRPFIGVPFHSIYNNYSIRGPSCIMYSPKSSLRNPNRFEVQRLDTTIIISHNIPYKWPHNKNGYSWCEISPY